jgi:NitT/TauT family transport system substrate-binding protein
VRRSIRSSIIWSATLVVALVSVVVAYQLGEDLGGADEATPTSPAPEVPERPGPGCSNTGRTDPDDLDAARPVARCAPGSPQSEPLDRTRRLRIAVGARSEAARAVLIADEQDELAAEGLDVDVVTLPVDEAHEALASGDVDVVVGELDAAFLDGVHEGSGARQVMGGTIPRAPDDLDVPQEGLWLRVGVIEDIERWQDIEGHSLGIPRGSGAAALYPMGSVLDQGGSSLNAVDLRPLGGRTTDALLGGEVSGAWVPRDEVGRLVVAGSFELLGTLPPSEPLDGTVVAADLLGEDRDVGLAFVRAIVRTINTHLTGEDAGDDAGARSATPTPVHDWEIRSGTLERLQKNLLEVGGVAYERPLPEDDLVDRSLVAEVVR